MQKNKSSGRMISLFYMLLAGSSIHKQRAASACRTSPITGPPATSFASKQHEVQQSGRLLIVSVSLSFLGPKAVAFFFVASAPGFSSTVTAPEWSTRSNALPPRGIHLHSSPGLLRNIMINERNWISKDTWMQHYESYLEWFGCIMYLAGKCRVSRVVGTVLVPVMYHMWPTGAFLPSGFGSMCFFVAALLLASHAHLAFGCMVTG